MTMLHALLLGLVEGFTEFLPISSTGHLILASKLLGLAETEFLKSFEIAIQLGAIVAVAFVERRRLRDLATLRAVAIAFVPTAIIGFASHGIAKRYLLGNAIVVCAALAIGGAVIIALERRWKRKPPARTVTDPATMPPKTAAAIGLCQAIAIIPGVSRSAATIIGGMALGVDRRAATEFSFLLAIPTMAAATGLDLIKSAGTFSRDDAGLLAVGFLASAATALVGIRLLRRVAASSDFSGFGWYRIALALVAYAFLR